MELPGFLGSIHTGRGNKRYHANGEEQVTVPNIQWHRTEMHSREFRFSDLNSVDDIPEPILDLRYIRPNHD